MPTLESKTRRNPCPTATNFDVSRHSPPIAPRWQLWQHWLVAGLLAAGLVAMQPFTLPMPREMGLAGPVGSSCQQDRAGQTALSRIAQQLQAQGMALRRAAMGPAAPGGSR